MKRRRPQTRYRILGADGEWFAWSVHGRLSGWLPHVFRIPAFDEKGWREQLAVHGRTPFEALERLKRIEARAC